jgi:hypothetical protein
MVACCLVLCAGVAFAHFAAGGGSFGLFGDPGGTDCNVWDVVPSVVIIYVVHVMHTGAIGGQFSAPSPPCNLMIWLSDNWIMPVTIGDSQTGVSVGYGGCLAAPTLVLSMNFFAQGITPPCCTYPVLPDPAAPSGQIEVMDCASNLLYATGGRAIINPTDNCGCNVPVEETTWGRVKAMYR